MQVLQSLVLLTENTPFVIFLAIDPRVVVTAIETSSNGMYSEAGVNGHEYLDKIVQIPFVIPQLADNEKSDLCGGYLTTNAGQMKPTLWEPVIQIDMTYDQRNELRLTREVSLARMLHMTLIINVLPLTSTLACPRVTG